MPSLTSIHDDPARSANPQTRPQYPYNLRPRSREQSEPIYGVTSNPDVQIPMPDGVQLMADVFRPFAPGRRFPALIAHSPYTRILQSTVLPSGQNEAGITEFWVPRGYVHVIVDARGTGDSEGVYDLLGPVEQSDVCEVIAWAASQPWCDGNV